jgi:hypothetical protein
MTKRIRNILRGAGSVVDLRISGNQSKVKVLLPTDSDREAIREDWVAVGKDIGNAMEQVKKQVGEHDKKT